MQCAKCNDTANGSTIVDGGVSYSFCKTCSNILETFPNTNIMHIFLTPDQMQSQVDRNIFEARKRRVKGERVWS
jgi:hypothetical protein